MKITLLKKIVAVLLGIWLVLIFMGKSGFVHLLLANGLGILLIDAIYIYRSNVRQ